MGKQTIGQQFRGFCLFVAFSIFLSGIAVWAYQGFVWLKYGYWKTLGSRLILDKVLPINFVQWLHNPHSWSGFNKIISLVFNSSLAIFLLVFGLVVYMLVAKAFDSFSEPEKTEIEVVRTKNWRRS